GSPIMLAHDLFARFVAHPTRRPSPTHKRTSQNDKIKSDQRKEIHGTPTPQNGRYRPSNDAARVSLPSNQPCQTATPKKPTPANPPGKNHHQEPNPSGPSGSHSILAMMPQVSNALQASLLGASDPQPRGTNPSAPRREDT